MIRYLCLVAFLSFDCEIINASTYVFTRLDIPVIILRF